MMMRIIGKKNMALRRDAAVLVIDAKAEEIRARFATPGKHTIYDKKLQEALAYIGIINSGNVPEGMDEFPYLQREVGLTAPTPYELAMLWIGMNQAWGQISALIEEVSLRGKYAVKLMNSQEEIDEVVFSTNNQLDAIGEARPSELRRGS